MTIVSGACCLLIWMSRTPGFCSAVCTASVLELDELDPQPAAVKAKAAMPIAARPAPARAVIYFLPFGSTASGTRQGSARNARTRKGKDPARGGALPGETTGRHRPRSGADPRRLEHPRPGLPLRAPDRPRARHERARPLPACPAALPRRLLACLQHDRARLLGMDRRPQRAADLRDRGDDAAARVACARVAFTVAAPHWRATAGAATSPSRLSVRAAR